MSDIIHITINGIPVDVTEDTVILDAAKKINVVIPTLCYHQDICVAGNCRVCMVEIFGQKRLAAACATPCEEGMDILTNSLKVRNCRKHIIELLLSEHNADCTKCYKNGKCELQNLASEYKIMTQDFIELYKEKNVPSTTSPPVSSRTTANVSVVSAASGPAKSFRVSMPFR